MSDIRALVTDNLEIWTSAVDRKSGSGRGSSKKIDLYGINRLRALVLDLAVRGKLIAQDSRDTSAYELLKDIELEKKRSVKSGETRKGKSLSPPSEWPFEIPTRWQWTQLGTITNYGQTEKADPGSLPADYWVLELEDVEKGTSRLLQKVMHTDRKFQSQKNKFEAGDVIYGKLRPYLDKVLVADEAGVCTTEMIPIRGYSDLLPQYVRLFLKSPFFIQLATKASHGMNLPRLATEKARAAPFPLPPLAEQKRIVAKVDELMALCDALEQESEDALAAHQTLVETLLATLVSSTDAADLARNWARLEMHFDTLFSTEASIDALKQTILNLAVRGKLVAQDSSDGDADELLRQTTSSKIALVKEGKAKRNKRLPKVDPSLAPFELPKSWTWARFPELGIFERGKSKHRPRNDPKLFQPGIYPLVQTGEVARSGGVIEEFHSQYSEMGLAQSKLWPSGTLCITIAANIADAATLGFDACFPDSVVGFIPCQPIPNAQYFLYFMRTAKADLLKFAPSTAQKNINLGILESVLIPLPPVAEQDRIIAKVDELMVLCDALKARLADVAATQRHLADATVERAAA